MLTLRNVKCLTRFVMQCLKKVPRMRLMSSGFEEHKGVGHGPLSHGCRYRASIEMIFREIHPCFCSGLVEALVAIV